MKMQTKIQIPSNSEDKAAHFFLQHSPCLPIVLFSIPCITPIIPGTPWCIPVLFLTQRKAVSWCYLDVLFHINSEIKREIPVKIQKQGHDRTSCFDSCFIFYEIKYTAQKWPKLSISHRHHNEAESSLHTNGHRIRVIQAISAGQFSWGTYRMIYGIFNSKHNRFWIIHVEHSKNNRTNFTFQITKHWCW